MKDGEKAGILLFPVDDICVLYTHTVYYSQTLQMQKSLEMTQMDQTES